MLIAENGFLLSLLLAARNWKSSHCSELLATPTFLSSTLMGTAWGKQSFCTAAQKLDDSYETQKKPELLLELALRVFTALVERGFLCLL